MINERITSKMSLTKMVEALAQDNLKAHLCIVDTVMHIIDDKSSSSGDYINFLLSLDKSGLYQDDIVQIFEIVCEKDRDRFILLVKAFKRDDNNQVDYCYLESYLKTRGFNDVDIKKIKAKLDIFILNR